MARITIKDFNPHFIHYSEKDSGIIRFINTASLERIEAYELKCIRRHIMPGLVNDSSHNFIPTLNAPNLYEIDPNAAAFSPEENTFLQILPKINGPIVVVEIEYEIDIILAG